MSFEQNIIDIKKLYTILTGKEDNDVICFYKGTSHGRSKPWVIKIDTKEFHDIDHELAAEGLINLLKQELSLKISNLEQETVKFRKALGSFNN